MRTAVALGEPDVRWTHALCSQTPTATWETDGRTPSGCHTRSLFDAAKTDAWGRHP